MRRQRWPLQVKVAAVAALEAGRDVHDVAAEFGTPNQHMIMDWRVSLAVLAARAAGLEEQRR